MSKATVLFHKIFDNPDTADKLINVLEIIVNSIAFDPADKAMILADLEEIKAGIDKVRDVLEPTPEPSVGVEEPVT